MYPNDTWVNTISTNETIIYEQSVDSTKVREHMNYHIYKDIH